MEKRTERTILKITLGFLIVFLLTAGSLLVIALTSSDSTSNTVETMQISKQEAISIASSVARGTVTEVELDKENEEEEEDEEEDVPITGNALDRASAAALKHIGEGRVTDTEIGDEEGYYEIEIRLDNSNEVDVHLDENFNVISTEYEDEEDDD